MVDGPFDKLRRPSVSDALFDGWRLRAQTVVDAFIREARAIDVDQGIKGEQVVEAMARISSIRGAPRTIRLDNRPEFISKALYRWAYENGVTLDFSRSGKPTENSFLESFNGRLRDECLNTHCSCRWRTPGPRSRPNERWKLTLDLDEKLGDPHC